MNNIPTIVVNTHIYNTGLEVLNSGGYTELPSGVVEIAAVFAPTTSATDTIRIDRTGGTGISVEVDGMETIYTGTTNTITLPLINHDFLVKAKVLGGGVLSYCNFGHSTIKEIIDADTSNVTTMYQTWYGCSSLTKMPDVLDTSNVTNIELAWYGCSSLTKMPDVLDTSNVTTMLRTWNNCSSLTKMPDVLDTSNVTTMYATWLGCSSLTKMPDILDTSNVTNLELAWFGCSLLTHIANEDFLKNTQCTNLNRAFEGCALVQSEVDKILVNLDSNNTSNGTLHIIGGTNATPSQAGKDAADALVGRGWSVKLNGYTPS